MDAAETRSLARFTVRARLAAVLGVFAAMLAVLMTLIRPWYLSWGTTAAERDGALPGDSL